MKLKDLTDEQKKEWYNNRAKKAQKGFMKKTTKKQRKEIAKKAGLSTKLSKQKYGKSVSDV